MNVTEVLEMNRDLFLTAMLIALPALAMSLIVGLLVSVFQTVTSIQDQTLSYVPRIILVGLTIIFTMAFTLEQAVEFTRRMFGHAVGASQ
ncbi:MAG: flagellar biosynthetic protein FliQ [Gemmataceae bacterium]|jgi:flagellar biosynthetic protein FliQ|nr:flagellar biosynthetic protein FliQ [Gemmataceae bacterium]